MSLSLLPKLPLEVIALIIHHLTLELKDWEDVRRYLHLRLVSTWFGSIFEESAFKEIGVEIESSPSSTSNHLLKLLRSSDKIARHIRSLHVKDFKAYRALAQEAAAHELFSSAWHASRQMLLESAAKRDKQMAALIENCNEVTNLRIYSIDHTDHTHAISPFSGDLKSLRMVSLYNAAFARHFRHFIQLNRSDVALMLDPPAFRPAGDRTPDTFMGQLFAGWHLPPMALECLVLHTTCGVSLVAPVLDHIPVRPRLLCLGLRSVSELQDAADALLRGSFLATLEELGFWFPQGSKDEAAQAVAHSLAAIHIHRLEAAGLLGLQVAVQWGPH